MDLVLPNRITMCAVAYRDRGKSFRALGKFLINYTNEYVAVYFIIQLPRVL